MRSELGRAVRRAVLTGAMVATGAATVVAQGPSREEVLAAVFPGASIRAEQVFLTAEQVARAAALAGVEIPSALVARYLAETEGRSVGRAYVDTHVVRTKRESLLVSLDAAGLVRRVDVLAFLEPPEYKAPASWLHQFSGHTLDDELRVQRAIRPLAGATLSARSATEATRRVLAIDRVLNEGSAGATR